MDDGIYRLKTETYFGQTLNCQKTRCNKPQGRSPMRLCNLISTLALSLLFASMAVAQGVSPESAAKYNEGQDLFQKRRFPEALKAFEESASLDNKNAQAYRALGRTYRQLRNMDKAIEAYQMATSVRPDYAAAYFELGELQAAMRKYDDAQNSFKKVLDLDPKFEDGKARENLQKIYQAQGNEHFRRKNYKMAVQAYENATQLDPSDASAFYNLGLANKNARNYAGAETAFNTAIDLDDSNGRAYRALGDLYQDTDKHSQAVSTYLKAIQADPKDTNVRLRLAMSYQQLNQNDRAIAALQQANTVDPKDAKILIALGQAYAQSKQYQNALGTYEKALAIDNDPEVHYRMGSAYLELKQYQRAIASAQKAVSNAKFRVPSHVVLGDSYRGLDQKEKAIEHYKQGLEDRVYRRYCEDQIDRILNPMGTVEDLQAKP